MPCCVRCNLRAREIKGTRIMCYVCLPKVFPKQRQAEYRKRAKLESERKRQSAETVKCAACARDVPVHAYFKRNLEAKSLGRKCKECVKEERAKNKVLRHVPKPALFNEITRLAQELNAKINEYKRGDDNCQTSDVDRNDTSIVDMLTQCDEFDLDALLSRGTNVQ